MKYTEIVHGKFHSRPNRFLANVWIEGEIVTVHVKNTGRCRELLLPGADVILAVSDNPNRKTKYDLVCVYKKSLGWVNMDSQAPNRVVKEWLAKEAYSYVKPEYSFGESRIDFYMEQNGEKYLMEVKGCTLEIDGIGYFPDAPTERGIKHINELMKAVQMGYHAVLAYVIQMEQVSEVRSNNSTHKEYGEAIEKAREAGVEIWFLKCSVSEDTLVIKEKIQA